MNYKPNQILQQRDRDRGREYKISCQKMPRHMNTMHRQIGGVTSQPATYQNLSNMNVMVRRTQYTIQERSDGLKGMKSGRQRFTRLVDLLNAVQAETIAFPEILDFIEIHNRDDFSLDNAELARQEPCLVTEYLQGDSLDRFGYRLKPDRVASAILNPDNNYWFSREKELNDKTRYHSFAGHRVAKLLSRIATHCLAVLRCGVVHLDLKPEHILVLHKDEVPRLLGIGHLARLDDQGCVNPADPAHAFTTAGFVAPEIVSAETWNTPLNGEALMLYSLGAIALALLYTGPQADLCELWRHEGREGVDELIRKMMTCGKRSRNAQLFKIIQQLLTVDPQQRLVTMNMATLIEQLDRLTYYVKSHAPVQEGQERAKNTVTETLTCKRCNQVFQGDLKRSTFIYHKKNRFTLCLQHHQEARQSVSYPARICGHTVTEPQGYTWAREWMGWNALARCRDCRK